MDGLTTSRNWRRCTDRDDCWQIYCGDIHAGTIALTTTTNARTEWRWSAGFQPGSMPREIRNGTAHTFETAKEEFLAAWLAFSQSRKPEDFEEWRDYRDLTAWRNRMHDEGLKLPTQFATGRARC